MEGVSGNWQAKVKVTAEPHDIGKADLILVCVKSYDTKSALLQAKSLVGEDTLVLTLQNGIGNLEVIAEIVGEDKVMGGMTNMGSILRQAGCITHTGKGETIIGFPDGKVPVLMRSLRERL